MNMDVLVIMLLIAILLYTIWWNYKKMQANNFRCKFFELRSKLRDLVITNDFDPNNKLYIYLDNYLSSIINDISNVNLYKSLIMNFVIKKKYSNFSAEAVISELKSQPELDAIFNKLVNLLAQYSIRKHLVTLISLVIISLPIFKSIEIIKDVSQDINIKLKNNYRLYEETLAAIG